MHGYLQGAPTPRREHDLVALAINERLGDLGMAHRLAFHEDLGPIAPTITTRGSAPTAKMEP
jgi:hypothetical protein